MTRWARETKGFMPLGEREEGRRCTEKKRVKRENNEADVLQQEKRAAREIL